MSSSYNGAGLRLAIECMQARNSASAAVTALGLMALAAESDAPINVLVSSPGGHLESGESIHDMVRFIDVPVT